jgi:hypothetical protein
MSSTIFTWPSHWLIHFRFFDFLVVILSRLYASVKQKLLRWRSSCIRVVLWLLYFSILPSLMSYAFFFLIPHGRWSDLCQNNVIILSMVYWLKNYVEKTASMNVEWSKQSIHRRETGNMRWLGSFIAICSGSDPSSRGTKNCACRVQRIKHT